MRSIFKILEMKDLRYAGSDHTFWFVINESTGEPLHEVCGFLCMKSIEGKLKSLSTKNYASDLKLFWEEFVIPNQEAHKDKNWSWKVLSDQDLVEYFHFRKKQGLTGNSIQRQVAAVQSFYDWAYQSGIIDLPREVEVRFDLAELSSKETSIRSQYITKKEFTKVLSGIPAKSRYLKLRNKIALLFGYECGFRSGELVRESNLNVKWLKDQIKKSEHEGKLSFEMPVVGKRNKSRQVLVTPSLFQQLDIFLNDKKLRGAWSDDLPFFLDGNGKPIKTSNTKFGSDLFTAARKNAGLYGDTWGHRHFHSLRHTFATNLAGWCYEKNKSWMTILPYRMGHTDWTTSLIYVEADALLNAREKQLQDLKASGKLRRYRKNG